MESVAEWTYIDIEKVRHTLSFSHFANKLHQKKKKTTPTKAWWHHISMLFFFFNSFIINLLVLFITLCMMISN
jgi:hypothetical protein